MINYIKRNDLEVNKYDACIVNAINSRIYAFSSYLDIVADNWDALVLNDYEAVMPLTWRQKYFIKYVYPPAWTQQLGIFSDQNIPESLVWEFINAIPKKFKKVTIQFNSGNPISGENVTERVNYILSLNKLYEDIYKGFNSNRKRDLNKAKNTNCLIDKCILPNEFINFYLNSTKNYKVTDDQIQTINKLVNSKNKSVQIWGVRNNHNLEASMLFLNDDKRITNLLPIASDFAKENGFTTLLIDEMILTNQHSTKLFDFEGSMINGVADFYKSFGTQKEVYFKYHRNC